MTTVAVSKSTARFLVRRTSSLVWLLHPPLYHSRLYSHVYHRLFLTHMSVDTLYECVLGGGGGLRLLFSLAIRISVSFPFSSSDNYRLPAFGDPSLHSCIVRGSLAFALVSFNRNAEAIAPSFRVYEEVQPPHTISPSPTPYVRLCSFVRPCTSSPLSEHLSVYNAIRLHPAPPSAVVSFASNSFL